MGVRGQETAGDRALTSPVSVEWVSASDLAQTPVSIVIPTYNGLDHLRICLPALRETLPRRAGIDVIVVDDGSTDDEFSRLRELAQSDRRVRLVHNATNVGFLESCNIGAAEAEGDVIVFLNNDTMPIAGWLPPLLRVFRRYPDAGAVGGKLVYPDGRLQEAGAIIFSDATGANVGRGSLDLDEPLYSYVREVDYCSAALLATKRDLFFEAGGFDRRYRPAYFEDADYCFRLRSLGFRTYFQPESMVVHLEGGTCGTDESSGIKRHQRLNRTKFREQWSGELRRRPSNPQRWGLDVLHRLAVREEPGKRVRRALVCAPLMPAYDRESGAQSILDLVLYLRDANWAVSYVAENPNGDGGERYGAVLRQAGVATYGGFGTRTDELIAHGDFDLAIFAFWYIAEQLMPRVRALSPTTRVAVNTMDLHFLRNARRTFERRASANGAAVLDETYAAEFIRELNTYAWADACFAVSRGEADLINHFVGDPELAYVVSDYEHATSSGYAFDDRRGILFVGNFRHPPNAEAVEYLCREIVPRLDSALLEEHPLTIVGNALDGRVRDHAAGLPHVRTVGWVPSILLYFQRARVAVTPLLHGAGTKRKQLQALMAGTPSVSTAIGIEGFDLRPGEDVLVADEPDAFAEAITRLLSDRVLWERVARNGQASTAPLYGREAVQKRFLDVVTAVLAKDPKAGMASAFERTYVPSREYQALVDRVRECVAELIPAGSVVAVVSRGDDELLRFRDVTGWHFPRTDGGAYGGYHPADSAAAISHLGRLKAAGAQFLVFPAPAFWWLDHYIEFAEHLESNYRTMFRDEETCLIFALC
jgi:O-antigen biosynthesis protein